MTGLQQADAPNPAIAPRFAVVHHWRRVTDLERWAAATHWHWWCLIDSKTQRKGHMMKKGLSLAVGLFIAAPFAFSAEQASDVVFSIGPKNFRKGDAITIETVSASSPNFAVGDKVTVRGRYTLASADKARLCLNLTTDAKANIGPEPESPEHMTEVAKGSGTFELTETLKHPGHLHVSFYAGSSFGTIYFGTEKQMNEIRHWKIGH
jgi:hypothetical protein